jgi:hypothetical protein
MIWPQHSIAEPSGRRFTRPARLLQLLPPVSGATGMSMTYLTLGGVRIRRSVESAAHAANEGADSTMSIDEILSRVSL